MCLHGVQRDLKGVAPRQYSQKLSSKLINAGARPLVVPGVAITELEGAELEQMRGYLRALLADPHPASSLSHIAFTSKNGIFALLDQLAAVAGGEPGRPQHWV
eukprot:XP_001695830.1 predicted protein [Chlamydomonas reinhardtii]